MFAFQGNHMPGFRPETRENEVIRGPIPFQSGVPHDASSQCWLTAPPPFGIFGECVPGVLRECGSEERKIDSNFPPTSSAVYIVHRPHPSPHPQNHPLSPQEHTNQVSGVYTASLSVVLTSSSFVGFGLCSVFPSI